MEGRKETLIKIFDGIDENLKSIILPLIDDVVFLENTLRDLRKLPFIKVKSDNPALQKPTPASKQYKELLQQYNNCIKILCGVLGKTEGDESSPLRDFLKMMNDRNV